MVKISSPIDSPAALCNQSLRNNQRKTKVKAGWFRANP
jgi:hypothetical protein